MHTRLTLSLMLVSLIAACSCGGGGDVDGGRDAADAPVDDNRDLYEFILEAGNTDDCGEWDVPPHPTTRLSLAPPGTAEVLWEWSPLDEPSLPPPSRPYSLSQLALGPDGSVWGVGVDGRGLINVTHDGRLRSSTQLVDLPIGVNLSGFGINVLPDGSALYTLEPSWTVRVYPTGGFVTLWDDRGAARQTGFVAAAAGQRVYLADRMDDGQVWLVASCNGYRDRYVWRLQVRTPWAPGGYYVGGPVLEDGSMLSLYEDAFLRISPEGQATWLSEPAPYRPGFVTVPHQLAAGTQLVETGSIGAGFRLRALTVATGEETWGLRLPEGSGRVVTWSMDARGNIAIVDGGGTNDTFEVLDPRGTVVWTRAFAERPAFGASTEGGGWIAGGPHSPDGAGISRVSATGLESWRITLGVPYDQGGGGVLDVDGRYYAVVTGGVSSGTWGPVRRLVAIQTDALPPRGDVCLESQGSYACNAHHSNWTSLYQPVPPSD